MPYQQKSDEEVLAEYEAEIEAAKASGMQSSYPYSPAMFQGGKQKQNIVEWELDFAPEIKAIERLLKSDILVRNTDGSEDWIENPDKTSVVFNQQGVNDILRQIVLLINKNKVLSYYKIDEIKPRVQMIGHELRAFIYNNYEKYGMDNEYKQNNFSIMVLSILDIIEAAYRRALMGETHRGLNEARVLQQTEPIMPQNIYNYPQSSPQKKGFLGKLNPFNWGR